MGGRTQGKHSIHEVLVQGIPVVDSDDAAHPDIAVQRPAPPGYHLLLHTACGGPDVNKSPDAADKFKEAQEAYACLSDKDNRAKYDKYGHAAFENPTGGAGGAYQGNPFGNFDFGDIFDDLFGGGFGSFSSFNTGRGSQNRARKGADTLYGIKIDFMEAVYGCKKDIEIEYYEKCDDCDGLGGHKEVTCDECDGRGYIIRQTNTILGAIQTKSSCSACNGKGKVFKTS